MDLIIEAVPEKIELKKSVFRELEGLAPMSRSGNKHF